jgi:hypothetical protein
MPMIAMTVRSSIKVKPAVIERGCEFFIELGTAL